MLARWREGEQREALAMPIRKQIDQHSARQQFFETPTDDLGDAGGGDALFQHRLGSGASQGAAGRNLDRLLFTDEFPVERPTCIRIEKLQASMAGEIRGTLRFAVSFDIARRSYGEDRSLDQLARDERRETGLSKGGGGG